MSSEEDAAAAMLSNLEIGDDGSSGVAKRPKLTLVVDVSYGFPTQKKPRRERINAVSGQLANFSEWWHQGRVGTGGGDDARVEVTVAGGKDSISEVRRRMVAIGGEALALKFNFVEGDPSSFGGQATAEGSEEGEGEIARASASASRQVVYLSPDAEEPLDVADSAKIPEVVVVGGLVDRKITPGRSARKAKEYKIDCRRLPVSLLELDELHDDEALNIDTVLEMCAGWAVESGREKFKRAATSAMLRHQSRHPNRPIHSGLSRTTGEEPCAGSDDRKSLK